MNSTNNKNSFLEFSTIKSKWPILLIGLLVLLAFSLIPLAIGNWGYKSNNEIYISYLVVKITFSVIFVLILLQVSFTKQARGVTFWLLVLATIPQAIPFTIRFFGLSPIKINNVWAWISFYTIIVFVLILAVYISLNFMNMRMLKSDKKFESKRIDLSHHYDQNKQNSRDNYEERF